MSLNRRSCLKQYLPLFSAKLNTDFSLYRITARHKTKLSFNEIATDIPLAVTIKDITLEMVVIEITMHYEGG